ncbi:hypothetical protein QC762_121870 [Podospora pseudocomata]|uniref:BZIP domain-containing protein n=1 Tax=Podospora pseudocomata TaxID=2093779 RepID=A0ABR0GYK9_9PEZI|nr:hypothetical protein QC762_121870 [Podospora pseudocomata]
MFDKVFRPINDTANSSRKGRSRLPEPVRSPTRGGIFPKAGTQARAPQIPQRLSSASQSLPWPASPSAHSFHLRQLKQELAEKDRKVKILCEEVEGLKKEKESLEREIDQYDDECFKMEAENKQLRDAFVALKGNPNHHIDDGVVQSRFGEIKFTIEQIVSIRYSSSTTISKSIRLDRPSKQLFSNLAEDVDRYLTQPVGKALLIEAFIWNFLISEVFSGNGMLWAGKAFEHVKFLSRELENDTVSLADLYRWNAQTASMLFSMYDLDKRRIQKIASNLRASLEPWQNKSFKEGQCDSLDKLVLLAAKLDADLARSRAEYMVFMLETTEALNGLAKNKYGVPFDQDYMELQSGNNDRYGDVELVVSPTVAKVGDSDGENYDCCTVLVRAKVICGGSKAGRRQQSASTPSNSFQPQR